MFGLRLLCSRGLWTDVPRRIITHSQVQSKRLAGKQEQRFWKPYIAKSKNKQGVQSVFNVLGIRAALAHCILFIRRQNIRKYMLFHP